MALLNSSINKGDNNRPIGIFDSGVGGLTVVSEIKNALPGEDIIYFGDTARFPYGPKSKQTIVSYSMQIANFLMQFDIKLLIVACNTATSLALPELQNSQKVPVIGVIEPAIMALENAISQGKTKIGVIGTRSTIRSHAYLNSINQLYPQAIVFQKACPLFVTIVEEGWANKKITADIAHEYIDEMMRENVQSLILGCTHYPLLKTMLRQEFPSIDLIDVSIETAKAVKHFLLTQNMLANELEGKVDIYISDMTDYFVTLERLFFGDNIHSIRDIRLINEEKTSFITKND